MKVFCLATERKKENILRGTGGGKGIQPSFFFFVCKFQSYQPTPFQARPQTLYKTKYSFDILTVGLGPVFLAGLCWFRCFAVTPVDSAKLSFLSVW
jgi:hypothetical protein